MKVLECMVVRIEICKMIQHEQYTSTKVDIKVEFVFMSSVGNNKRFILLCFSVNTQITYVHLYYYAV